VVRGLSDASDVPVLLIEQQSPIGTMRHA